MNYHSLHALLEWECFAVPLAWLAGIENRDAVERKRKRSQSIAEYCRINTGNDEATMIVVGYGGGCCLTGLLSQSNLNQITVSRRPRLLSHAEYHCKYNTKSFPELQ